MVWKPQIGTDLPKNTVKACPIPHSKKSTGLLLYNWPNNNIIRQNIVNIKKTKD